MTYVPMCDFDGHFWPKKKHLYYIAVGSGNAFVRYRLRFCANHVETVEENLADYEVLPIKAAAGSMHSRVSDCFACGQPIEQDGVQWFITGYPAQDQRKDYWGRLHDEHALPEYLQAMYGPQDPIKSIRFGPDWEKAQ